MRNVNDIVREMHPPRIQVIGALILGSALCIASLLIFMNFLFGFGPWYLVVGAPVFGVPGFHLVRLSGNGLRVRPFIKLYGDRIEFTHYATVIVLSIGDIVHAERKPFTDDYEGYTEWSLIEVIQRKFALPPIGDTTPIVEDLVRLSDNRITKAERMTKSEKIVWAVSMILMLLIAIVGYLVQPPW